MREIALLLVSTYRLILLTNFRIEVELGRVERLLLITEVRNRTHSELQRETTSITTIDNVVPMNYTLRMREKKCYSNHRQGRFYKTKTKR
jgi:hypothetical protein